MNISLKMPTGDCCSDYLLHEEAVKNAECQGEQLDEKVISENELHDIKVAKAANLYKIDETRAQDDKERVYCMDLQKVILIPRMPQIKLFLLAVLSATMKHMLF